MAKTKAIEETPPEALPGEFGPITYPEYLALPEEVRRRRAQRAYKRLIALHGKIDLKIDIDELRGRNR
ncbi:MAG TPA: hypothetical protein VGD79_14025 [Thermoanaerobaculia bacterium]|jgi:hypothetical protein